MSIFAVILAVLLLLNLAWWWRVDMGLRRLGYGWRVRIWPFFWMAAMGGFLGWVIFSTGATVPIWKILPVPVLAAVYLWYLIILPAWLILAPLVGLIRLVIWWRQDRRTGKEKKSGGWSRREFVTWMAMVLPPIVLTGLTAISLPQLHKFRIRKFSLPIPNLPMALDGMTIAQVADTHVGAFTHGKTLSAIIEATNSLRADLILLPGDLINNDIKDLPAAIEMVKSLKARHGVFLCEGNHDLIPGRELFERQTKESGLQLLVNEAKMIEINGAAVQILGLRWGAASDPLMQPPDYSDEAILSSMEELLKLRDPSAFPILLAHHPHAFDPAAEAGLPLMVGGHTHGGQLMITENLGFGPAMYRYWSGIYRKGNSTLAVSNGVGNWFPLRTAAPAEILHLTLRRAG